MTRAYINRGGQTKEWHRRRERGVIVDLLRQAKSAPCADCGQHHPWYCMDFDHVRGIKRFTICGGSAKKGRLAVEREIAKCDIVCAICHRKRTYTRKHNFGRTDEQMAALNISPAYGQDSLFQ